MINLYIGNWKKPAQSFDGDSLTQNGNIVRIYKDGQYTPVAVVRLAPGDSVKIEKGKK